MLRALVIILALSLAPAAALAVPGRGPDHTLVAASGDAVDVVVTVIHAKKHDGGVAPELQDLQRYLVKSFPDYKSFAKLDASAHHLDVGAAAKKRLANGAELSFAHTGWKDGFAAIHLEVGGLSSTVNVRDGGTFFQAGRAYDGGMIVLVFHVRSAR